MTTEPTPTRIPLAHSVVYAVRGVPEVADEYNAERTIAPHEISLTYRTTEDSQLGRVHAYVKGWWMQDGQRVPMDKPVGRHFWGRDFDGWPEWLAEEARLHDPATETERLREEHYASLRRADEINNNLMEEVQRYADGEERPVLWSVYNQMHKRALKAEAEVDRLRRMADEAQTGTEAHEPEHTWAAELHDPDADEWVPGTRYNDRNRAVKHLAHARSIGPTWKDGTPVQRRLVRATTTYTVEDPS